jgi:hypothetical protein
LFDLFFFGGDWQMEKGMSFVLSVSADQITDISKNISGGSSSPDLSFYVMVICCQESSGPCLGCLCGHCSPVWERCLGHNIHNGRAVSGAHKFSIHHKFIDTD